jgi:hypothetical protein
MGFPGGPPCLRPEPPGSSSGRGMRRALTDTAPQSDIPGLPAPLGKT